VLLVGGTHRPVNYTAPALNSMTVDLHPVEAAWARFRNGDVSAGSGLPSQPSRYVCGGKQAGDGLSDEHGAGSIRRA